MKRIFAAALLALMSSLAVHAQATQPDPQSLRLIKALRLQDVIVQTTGAGVAEAQKHGAASKDGTACVARKLFQNLGDDLAMTVPKILTRPEITKSLAFFQSPTGRKLVAHNLAVLWMQYNGKPNPAFPDPAPTPDDTKLAREFLATPAGKKINQSGYLLQSPEMQQVIRTKSDAAIAACKPAGRGAG